ncbi:tryptophan 2,3-dioxygenase [Antrihabitans sp. YC3-6]|uniref:Tryptophan 2,3-dioxygenase n=1 Tax=Antrihabitans stalagmiti TaxID=2799499 RepID=A0A934U3I0_9NOCA|nr:tryptophan 2,3-dioxygenase family protein [Antrihabitans stalagmiti]MBJ8338928.1 tryptophan 2,3-dioxygenase [Antrihabitans stalagmiti]
MNELRTWLREPNSDTFPYDAVVATFHSGGKHSVGKDVLEALDQARSRVREGSIAGDGTLTRFLGVALDKFDGRFDNPSYLALDLLALPATDTDRCPVSATRNSVRLVLQLVTDIMHFELSALDGTDDRLPVLRPDLRTVTKRCRLGMRIARPAMARLGIAFDAPDTSNTLDPARQLCAVVRDDLSVAERLTLRLSILPVSLVHDEYLFIRVLQSYEATFAAVAVNLANAIQALSLGMGERATHALASAEQLFRDTSLLFSIVATMQPVAFLKFREYTDGASAIQSRNYKIVESLCRTPELSRIDSPAYLSVPSVRGRILVGQRTVDDAVASSTDRLTVSVRESLHSAMQQFEKSVLRWRKTHHRVASRMLGHRRGTGHTEGIPYLAEAKAIPIFGRCPALALLSA